MVPKALIESIAGTSVAWVTEWPLWRKLLIVLLLASGLAVFVILRWGVTREIETGVVTKTRGIQDPSPDPVVDTLWFLPNGTLVGTLKQTNETLVVSIWDPLTLHSERRSFPVPVFEQEIKNFATRRSSTNHGDAPMQTAVMRDGSKMVIYMGGFLGLFPNAESGGATRIVETQNTDDPFSIYTRVLAVTDNGLIALADSSGNVEFRAENNIGTPFGIRDAKISDPAIMKPVEKLLAIVSIRYGKIAILDLDTAKDPIMHGYAPTALDQFTLAVSPKGRVAIGRGQDEVRVSETDGGASSSLRDYGRIKVISFLDEDRVIVGGDFQDVHILAPGKTPQLLGTASQGIHALAVSSNRIAYAGNDGMVLLWYTTTRALNRVGFATLVIFLFILSGLVTFYSQATKRSMGASPLTIAPVVLQEEMGWQPVPDPPEALVKAFATGECMLYAGAGVSAQADFPTWESFIKNLTQWTIKNRFTDPRFGLSLEAALNQKLYDTVADNLVSILRPHEKEFNDYLRENFLKKTPLPPSISVLKALPFAGVLSTNFDNLLERAFDDRPSMPVYTPKDSESLLECLHKRQFFLLKLYGILERPDTVMIAPAQYDDVVKGNLSFSQFMETLLFSRTLLFVGSSLAGIEAYLKGISLPRQNLRPHYAVVAVGGDAWEAKAQPLKERYGIEVLPYSPTPGHPQLQQFLETLNRKVKVETGLPQDEADTGTVLKKILISNIGPFERLELDLDPHWNILLGDNGVGKSTIIRAIAVAILGQDAAAYAGRIIKSGQTQGVITLVTGRNTYQTKLSKKNGEAKVDSVPGRPFEGEGWLAVGFPPLRTVSWARPRAPEAESKGRPTTNDLLPVITGETDPRLDKLKQWIVNVDYWIKDAKSRGRDASKYTRLLTDFFNVVATLTKGVKIEFKEVKPQTNEVTIITDDGELPLESLSQGMTSLIGWVGILLQRLYEIYDDEQDPKLHYALVLMDEIDAHLHPAWQQSLIGELTRVFPNVQFIATTHSPLIVGGMNPKQIMRFARDDEQKVVAYKVEEEMTLGRADQILTSDLFGLKSTFALSDDLEGMKKEYHELLAKDRNDNEEIRFQKIREALKTRIPTAGEGPAERKAKQLIQALLHEDGDGKYASVNAELLEKAELLLNEVGKKKK